MINFINLSKEKNSSLIFDKPGDYVVFFHNLSGQFRFELMKKDINLEIYGLYIGKGEDQYKIETIQHHMAPNTVSNLLIKGVFDGESKFIYRGLVRIEKDAQRSHAYQKNQNLLLSPKSFVESKPDLEILANDVFCTHGSTTGKINEEEIFYIKSRGLTEKETRGLIVQGFINDIINKVRNRVPKHNFQFHEV